MFFVGNSLRKLSGIRFPVANLRGTSFDIEIPPDVHKIARSGSEAYGFPITYHDPKNGRLPAFMKLFMQNVPERDARTQFLVVEKELAASHSWMFHGVPFTVLGNGTQINGVDVVGHVALRIGAAFGVPAEDLMRLKSQGEWDNKYSLETRRFLAGQLCTAVSTMEEFQFIHGDLAPGNVMIGPGPKNGQPICTLCDYDGFSHPSVSPLPREFRTFGSPGYIYPELLDRMEADQQRKDESINVETDRFALAVLVCELVTWTPELGEQLGRDRLLSDRIPDDQRQNGNYIADNIRRKWPEGFDLLDKAVRASDVTSMPSPETWLRLLGVSRAFTKHPRLEIYEGPDGHEILVDSVEIKIQRTGDLSLINDVFSQVAFKIEEQAKSKTLTLSFGWKKRILVRRFGRRLGLDKLDGPCEVGLGPGDRLVADKWTIVAYDGPAQELISPGEVS